METGNLVELLVGAILGTIVGLILQSLRNYTSRAISKIKNSRILVYLRYNIRAKKLRKLLDQAEGCFYSPKTLKGRSIQLLTCEKWIQERILLPYGESPIVLLENDKYNNKNSTLHFDNNVSVARLFDGKICKIASYNDDKKFIVSSIKYQEYVAKKLQVDNSLITTSKSTRLLVKETHNAMNHPDQLIVLGATVALVQRTGNKYESLIHTRSSNVFVDPEKISFLPTFGVEDNRVGDISSKFGLLQHNIIREIGEEIFGNEEMVDNLKYDPDWFINSSNMQSLIKDWEQEKFVLKLLGISVDPWNPSVHFSLVAVSEIESFWTEYLKTGSLSWEIDKSTPPYFITINEEAEETMSQLTATETSRFLLKLLQNIFSQKKNTTTI